MGQRYMFCEIFTPGTPQHDDVLHAACNALSFMLARMTWWMRVLFTFFVIRTCALCFIIIIICPLTARVVWAPQMILQPVFSIFPCSPLPSGTCRTPGLSIPWCCLPTSSLSALSSSPFHCAFHIHCEYFRLGTLISYNWAQVLEAWDSLKLLSFVLICCLSSAWSSWHWSPCRRLWRLCRDAQLSLPVFLPLLLSHQCHQQSGGWWLFCLQYWQCLHDLLRRLLWSFPEIC